MNNYNKDELSLFQLLSSAEWVEYFSRLSATVNFEFSIYDGKEQQLFITRENSFCKLVSSKDSNSFNCPDFCEKNIYDSFSSTDPAIFKCAAGITNFVLPVQRSGEKVLVVGRGRFSLYEDFLDFLRICREHKLLIMPDSLSLDFHGDEYIEAVASYVFISIKRQLGGLEDKVRLEEKLLRVTALFDSQSFETLSGNPELVYRYILDTIEFVFGHTSSSFMLLAADQSEYKPVYGTGKHREAVMDFCLGADKAIVEEMIETKAMVSTDDLSKIIEGTSSEDIKSAYFFPVFIEKALKGVIAIFDREFSGEEIKIMNAYRDYVQINLENLELRTATEQTEKSDELLSSFIDLSNSINQVTDMKDLLETLLEKSLSLLKAEQGSLMIIDSGTSELVVEAKQGSNGSIKEKLRLKTGEGIAGAVAESGMPLLVEDIEEDPRITQKMRERYKTKSFLSLPIKIENQVKGVLNMTDKVHGGAFSERDMNLVQPFINTVAMAIQRTQLYEETEEYKRLSITDPLTGIYNRRYLNTRLTEEVTRYNRYKQPFSFLMFDLDGFKDYNDTYGHIAGDQLLKSLASVVAGSLRNIDIAARFGGDEFVVIFPQTPKVDAIQITNRLKEKIDSELARVDGGTLGVSMGLATFHDDASSIMELIEKTDQALYLAKKGGGDRVVYL